MATIAANALAFIGRRTINRAFAHATTPEAIIIEGAGVVVIAGSIGRLIVARQAFAGR